ncbi:MAG: Hopanoid C-3 methylase [Syntrophomonadaceae bacterium]|nr:Hopanoid C-3 methylase [Bacillota bacterium]MBT9147714.1 Hopanoid C-3 methylase [Bacillota bacterium]
MKILMAKTLAGSKFMDPPLITPLAIYTLSAILKEHGHEVLIVDPHVIGDSFGTEKAVEELVGGMDCVGFSVNSFNWPTTRSTISLIKKVFPEIKIIVGGIHATYFPEHILQVSGADIVIQGEGEKRLPLVIEALTGRNELSNIPGVTFRVGENIRSNPPADLLNIHNLDQAVPLYQLLPEKVYHDLSIESSRGCYANCCFCSVSYRSNWRGFDIEKTIECMRNCIPFLEKVQRGSLYFVDDCFTANPSRAAEIMDRLKQEKLNHKVGIEARVNDLLHENLLRALSSVEEVNFIQIGVECGYEEGLRMTRKGTTLVRVKEAASLLKKYGLSRACMWSFIVGLPWETKKECLETIHFAAELVEEYGGIGNVTWFVLMPSWIWEHRNSFGIKKDLSFFDERLWFITRKNFFDTHPGISEGDFEELESVIKTYLSSGIRLRVFYQFELVPDDKCI